MADKANATKDSASGKQKVKIAEPKKGAKDEDEDESSDEDEDMDDDEDSETGEVNVFYLLYTINCILSYYWLTTSSIFRTL